MPTAALPGNVPSGLPTEMAMLADAQRRGVAQRDGRQVLRVHLDEGEVRAACPRR